MSILTSVVHTVSFFNITKIANRKSNEPRYQLLYRHAQDIEHKLSRARKYKLEEEMKE